MNAPAIKSAADEIQEPRLLMKKLLSLTLLLSTTTLAFAQGKLSFANNSQHLVYFTTNTTMLAPGDAAVASKGAYTVTIGSLVGSPSLVVDLYRGTSPTSLSKQTTTTFSIFEGSWNAVNCTFGSLPAGQTAWFQIQIHDSRDTNATASMNAGHYYGTNLIFTAVPQLAAYGPIYQSNSPVYSTWAAGTFQIPDMPAGNLGAIELMCSRFGINGTVTYGTNGPGISNICVNLSGTQSGQAWTDHNGNYIFTKTPPGNYTVTPLATNGFVFTPTNAAITVSAEDPVGQADFIAERRVVELAALEVVQVIQDWSNSVPLIQDKQTWVRAFLQLAGTNTKPVEVQGVRLHGSRNAAPLPDSPVTAYKNDGSWWVRTTNAAALRGHFTNSLNFFLPTQWLSGEISLKFACTNNVGILPTNAVLANNTVDVRFIPSAVPRVKFYALEWGGNVLNQPAMDDLWHRLESIYPVATLTPSFHRKPAKTNDLPLVLAQLDSYWKLDSEDNKDTTQIIFGALPLPAPTKTLGKAIGIPGNVSAGFCWADPRTGYGYYHPYRHIISEEIGHCLGLYHDVDENVFGRVVVTNALKRALETNALGRYKEQAPLTAPPYPFENMPRGGIMPALGPMEKGIKALIYGLDTLALKQFPDSNPVVGPTNYFDLMSYAPPDPSDLPLDQWPSSYTYTNLYHWITNRFGAPSPPPGAGPPRKQLCIRGVMNFTTAEVELQPVLALTTTATNDPPVPPTGSLSVVLLDAGNSVLQVIPFEPDQNTIEQDGELTGSFLITVSADPAIRQVQVWDNTYNLMIAIITGSTNVPSVSGVTVASTNGSPFPGSGPLKLTWAGLDADPDAQLTYLAQYSADGGGTWETLLLDHPEQSYEVATDYLPASTQAVFRVYAMDGFNTSDRACSATFTVLNHPPAVRLYMPKDGELFMGDGQVICEVSAYDAEDGPLDGASVQWTSSRDGLLGNSKLWLSKATALSEGSHVVTVTATDSQGLTNSASVQVVVLRQPLPELSLQLDGSQVLVSWLASYTNYVLESSLSLMPSDSWSTVTNTPVAADIYQTVTLDFSSATNRFFRLRYQ